MPRPRNAIPPLSEALVVGGLDFIVFITRAYLPFLTFVYVHADYRAFSSAISNSTLYRRHIDKI